MKKEIKLTYKERIEMKLIDIAKNLDKSKDNEDWIDTTDIGDELGIEVPYVKQERLKCFWVGNWYCTDSYVGYRMYFFEDEPVAFSFQRGRKWDEEFSWFSEEIAQKVKEYLLTLVEEKEDELNIDVCDINEELGDHFKIEFNAQILNDNFVTLAGEKVKLLERIINKPHGIDSMQKIQLPNGEIKEVDIEELDFGFHLVPSENKDI